MGTKNQWAVYEWVIISDDPVNEWVLFLKARYMNGVGFEILARTPVPKLPPSPPPPSPEGEGRHIDYDVNPINVNIDIGISSGVKLSCFHSISLIDYIIWICLRGGWILMILTLYSRAPIA